MAVIHHPLIIHARHITRCLCPLVRERDLFFGGMNSHNTTTPPPPPAFSPSFQSSTEVQNNRRSGRNAAKQGLGALATLPEWTNSWTGCINTHTCSVRVKTPEEKQRKGFRSSLPFRSGSDPELSQPCTSAHVTDNESFEEEIFSERF